MRILSQDGRIDLPYENFSLSITQDNCIVAARDVIARPPDMLIGTVAKYSNLEKTQKAMEMLHDKYKQINVYLFNSKQDMIPPKVFKFPSEYEVDKALNESEE